MRARPADIDMLDGLWARMGRTKSAVVGVMVSMSGSPARSPTQVVQRRPDPVLLLDRADVERAVRELRDLRALLDRRLRALLDRAEVVVGSASQTGERRLGLAGVAAHRALSPVGPWGVGLPVVAGAEGFSSHVKALELPDPDWSGAAGTSSVALNVLLDRPGA